MKRPRLTPEQRALRARIAGLTGWSNTRDRTERARGAYAARRAHIAAAIDPEGVMAPEHLAAAVDARIKADMARLSLQASKARQRRRIEAHAPHE